MAKIVKIPLVMGNGEKATDMKSLRENFDVESVVGYFLDGRLEKWLNDRYYEDEAETIAQLGKDDPQLAGKLCDIFGVVHEDVEIIDPEEIAHRKERLARLKQLTDDEEILSSIDILAFDQEELAELYDQGAEKIYLCEGSFKIPKSKQGLEYVPVLGADVTGLPEKGPTASVEEKMREDYAPVIFRGIGMKDEATDKSCTIPVVYNRHPGYYIVKEVPVDFSKSGYDGSLNYAGYTKRHLVFSSFKSHSGNYAIILDRETGQIEDFKYNSHMCAKLVNGTDDYLLISGDDLWLYDVNHRTPTDLMKKFEFAGPFASYGVRSAFGVRENSEDFKVKIINLQTGEIEHTVSLPRRDKATGILLVDSGLYCTFDADSYPKRDAVVYFYEYNTKEVKEVCSFPGEEVSVGIMGSYAEKIYVKTYTKGNFDSGETNIYEISGSNMERNVFSEETYEGEEDYNMPYYVFAKKHDWITDIFMFNIATRDQRKVVTVDEDAEFGYLMYVDGSTLYFSRKEEDEDGDDEDVGYCIDLSDPNSVEKKCENHWFRFR